MAWNTENEDGSMVKVVEKSHKTALKIIGCEDKDISQLMELCGWHHVYTALELRQPDIYINNPRIWQDDA